MSMLPSSLYGGPGKDGLSCGSIVFFALVIIALFVLLAVN